jgi:dimethylargininase
MSAPGEGAFLAVTRPVSASFAECALTHLERVPIDVARAGRQHAAYEQALRALGAQVMRVPAAHELPDAVFVEDTAIVLDEIAVITRPGAPSRRAETAPVAEVLSAWRPLRTLEAPATLDGGDVLRVGHTVYVGLTSRTNREGIEQLGRHLAPLGYTVTPVNVTGCLHLKSAVTEVSPGLLLLSPGRVSPASFPGCEHVAVDEREPDAANALRAGWAVIFPSHHPATAARLAALGLTVVGVDCDELAKAEGAVTCCSLIVEVPAGDA